MGYVLEINTILKLPPEFNTSAIKQNDKIHLEKKGEHLLPLHKAIEFCDSNYQYIGKVVVRKLTIEKNKTTVDAQVLKIFNEEEKRVFSNNFIKQSDVT